MRGVGLAVAASAVVLGMAAPAAALTPPAFQRAYTEHLGQLITAPGKGGINELNARANGTAGMRGTDLGVSFESQGRLYFLFGDTFAMGAGTHLDDSIAVTDAVSADRFQMPRLTWAAGADASFAPLRIGDATFGGMEVPVEGLRADGRTYVFFVSGFHRNAEAALGCTRPLAVCTYDRLVLGHFDEATMRTGRLVFDEAVETSRFLNVSAVEYAGYVYLFGAGNPYRKSAVSLARFRAKAIDRSKQWRYLGRPLANGRVRWEQREADAAPLVSEALRARASSPCVETRRPAPSSWPTTATTPRRHPRGYYLRTAPRPWGPWSAPILLFDASAADGGYGVTQHFSTAGGRNPDDGLAEPDHLAGRDVFGGEYGPYLIPRFFRWEGGTLSVVYAHSSLEPVQGPPHADRPRPARVRGRPAGARRRHAAPDDPQRHLRRRHRRLGASGHPVPRRDAREPSVRQQLRAPGSGRGER